MNLENFNVKVVKKNQNNDLRLNSVHFQCHYSVEHAKENASYHSHPQSFVRCRPHKQQCET